MKMFYFVLKYEEKNLGKRSSLINNTYILIFITMKSLYSHKVYIVYNVLYIIHISWKKRPIAYRPQRCL